MNTTRDYLKAYVDNKYPEATEKDKDKLTDKVISIFNELSYDFYVTGKNYYSSVHVKHLWRINFLKIKREYTFIQDILLDTNLISRTLSYNLDSSNYREFTVNNKWLLNLNVIDDWVCKLDARTIKNILEDRDNFLQGDFEKTLKQNSFF
jgi:hypothetical protein